MMHVMQPRGRTSLTAEKGMTDLQKGALKETEHTEGETCDTGTCCRHMEGSTPEKNWGSDWMMHTGEKSSAYETCDAGK